MFKSILAKICNSSKQSKNIVNYHTKINYSTKIKPNSEEKTSISNNASVENLIKFMNNKSPDNLIRIIDIYNKAINLDNTDKATIDHFLNLKDYVIFLRTDEKNLIVKDLLYHSYDFLNKSMTYIFLKGLYPDYLNNIIDLLKTALDYKDIEETEKLLTYLELDVDCINSNNLTLLDYVKIEQCNERLLSLLTHSTKFDKIKLMKAIAFYSHVLKLFTHVRDYIDEVIDYDNILYKDYEEIRLLKLRYNLVIKSQSHLEVDASITINSLNEAIVVNQKINANKKLKDILVIHKGELYRGIYYAYIAEGDIDMALKVFVQLEAIYNEDNDEYNLSLSYFFVAGLYINRNDYNNVIRYTKKFYESLNNISHIKEAISDEINFERKMMLYKDVLDFEQRVAVCESLFYIYESSIEEDIKVLPYLEEYNLNEVGILMYKAFDLFFPEFNTSLFFLYFKILSVNFQLDNKKICIEMGEEILEFLNSDNDFFDENQLKQLYIETYFSLIVCYNEIDPDKSNDYIEKLYESYSIEDIGSEKEKTLRMIKENNFNKL
jgi:hypothetical protein